MQDISINLIRYFVTLADCKQFTKASEKIMISQPALTKSIQNLESILNRKLIDRFQKGFTLTEEGKHFYETSIYFLSLYDEYLNEISEPYSSLYSGTVKIIAPGALLDVFLPDLFMKFKEVFPDIKLSFFEEDTEQATQSLADRKADICFALSPLSIKSGEAFYIKTILKSKYQLVFSEDHPFSALNEVDISQIDKENIMLPGESSRMRKMLLENCNAHGVKPNITVSCSQINTLLSLVKKKAGFAVLPEIMLDHINAQGVSHRPLMPFVSWDLAVIYPNSKYISPMVKNTCDFLIDYFSEISVSN